MQSGIICEVCVCPLHIYSSVASKKDLSLLSPVCVYSWGFLQIYFWWHQQHKASPFLLVHVTYCSPQLHSYLPSYESKWELDLACSGKAVGNKTWLKWSLILFTKWCCKPECQRSRSGEVCNWRCPWHLSCKRKERRAEQCNNEWPKQPNRTKITPFIDFLSLFWTLRSVSFIFPVQTLQITCPRSSLPKSGHKGKLNHPSITNSLWQRWELGFPITAVAHYFSLLFYIIPSKSKAPGSFLKQKKSEMDWVVGYWKNLPWEKSSVDWNSRSKPTPKMNSCLYPVGRRTGRLWVTGQFSSNALSRLVLYQHQKNKSEEKQ